MKVVTTMDEWGWKSQIYRRGYSLCYAIRPRREFAWRNPAALVEGMLQPDHRWDIPAHPAVFSYLVLVKEKNGK